MMAIDDADLRWAILKYLGDRIEAGEAERLIAAGLAEGALGALRGRSGRDLMRVAQDVSIGFHLQLDGQRLALAFVRLDAMLRDQQRLEYFVRHGAPTPMLIRLFRASHRELRALRQALRSPEAERGGRPNLPDPATRERVQAAWAQSAPGHEATCSERTEERERLYALHQRFPAYTLGALWTVINEFGASRVPTRSPCPGRRSHG